MRKISLGFKGVILSAVLMGIFSNLYAQEDTSKYKDLYIKTREKERAQEKIIKKLEKENGILKADLSKLKENGFKLEAEAEKKEVLQEDMIKGLVKENSLLKSDLREMKERSSKLEAGVKEKENLQDYIIKGLVEENRVLKSDLKKFEKDNSRPTVKDSDPLAKDKRTKRESRNYINRSEDLSVSFGKIEAEAAFFKDKLKESEQKFETFKATVNREKADLYTKLGTVYTEAKFYDLAIEAYDSSLRLLPVNADVHYNLGILYKHKNNDNKKAVYHLKEYLRLNPDAKNKREVNYLIKMLVEEQNREIK